MKPDLVPILLCLATLTGFSPRTTLAAASAEERPFLAIWRDHEGHRPESKAPYLRIAIWNNGRIVYAVGTNKWNQELREGKLEATRIEELKKELAQTGVFELEGNCYLVPDAPVDCVMLDLVDRQQMLYWDEIEIPNYGINIAPKPQHLKFMSCWKEVNRLALAAIPKESQSHQGPFQRPPSSWRLKRPIQSK